MDDLTTRLEEGNLDSPKDNSADLRNNNLPQDKTIKAEAIEDNNDLFFPYQSGLFFEDSSRVASIISSSSSIDPLELAIEQIVQRTNSSVATLTIPRSVLETDSNYHEIFYPTLEENSSIESPDTEAYVTDLVGEDPFNSGYSSNSSDSSFFQIYLLEEKDLESYICSNISTAASFSANCLDLPVPITSLNPGTIILTLNSSICPGPPCSTSSYLGNGNPLFCKFS